MKLSKKIFKAIAAPKQMDLPKTGVLPTWLTDEKKKEEMMKPPVNPLPLANK